MSSAFLQIIELHGIKLSATDQAALKLHFEKNGGYLKYKEVLQTIQINKEAADPLAAEWLFVRAPPALGKGHHLSQEALQQLADDTKSVSSRASLGPSLLTQDLSRFKEQISKVLGLDATARPRLFLNQPDELAPVRERAPGDEDYKS